MLLSIFRRAGQRGFWLLRGKYQPSNLRHHHCNKAVTNHYLSRKYSVKNLVLLASLVFALPVNAEIANITPFTNSYQSLLAKDSGNAIEQLSQILEQNNLSEQSRYFIQHNLAYSYRLNNKKELAISYFDRAIKLSEDIGPYYQARSLLERAKTYGILFRDTDRAIIDLELAFDAVKLSQHQNASRLTFDLSTAMTQAYNQKAELDKAQMYIEQAIKIAEQSAHTDDLLYANIIAGRVSFQQDKLAKAHRHYQNALKLVNSKTPKPRVASIELRLSIIFSEQGLFDKSIEHANNAASLYLDMGQKRLQVKAMRVLGDAYLAKGNRLDQALIHFLNALALAQELNDKTNISQLEHVIGKAYLAENNIEQAQNYLNAASNILNPEEFPYFWALNNTALAELANRQQQYPLAQALLEQTLNNEKVAEYPAVIERIEQHLSELYLSNQNYQQAYQLANKRLVRKRQALEELQQVSITNTEEQLSNAQLNVALVEANTKLTQSQTALSKYQEYFYLLLGVVITLIVILIVMFRQKQRLQQKHNNQQFAQLLSWQQFWQQLLSLTNTGDKRHLHVLSISPRDDSANNYAVGNQIQRSIYQVIKQAQPDTLVMMQNNSVLWLSDTADNILIDQHLVPVIKQYTNSRRVIGRLSIALDNLPKPMSEQSRRFIESIISKCTFDVQQRALEDSELNAEQYWLGEINIEKNALNVVFNKQNDIYAGIDKAQELGMLKTKYQKSTP